MSQQPSQFRESYVRGVLRRADLADDPIEQFERWWQQWIAQPRYDPAACVLATADADGRPSARYVLCRRFGPDGFEVFTNQRSAKGRDLAANPRAALVFGWLEDDHQVRVEGPVTLVSDADADAYWLERPRGSRIGALASEQSSPISGREELERRRAEAEARFGAEEDGPPVPRPDHWGGYRVGIERIEFWQGRPDRLHDRFEYRPDPGSPTGWTVTRLAP